MRHMSLTTHSSYCTLQGSGSQTVALQHSVTWGSLKMQIPLPTISTESESLGADLAICMSVSPPGDCDACSSMRATSCYRGKDEGLKASKPAFESRLQALVSFVKQKTVLASPGFCAH